MTPEAFRALLRDPATGPRLDAMLAANRALDAQVSATNEVIALAPKVNSPRDCCADFAYVTICDGATDTWICPFCTARWEAPCR